MIDVTKIIVSLLVMWMAISLALIHTNKKHIEALEQRIERLEAER